jgi:hypothetical protein
VAHFDAIAPQWAHFGAIVAQCVTFSSLLIPKSRYLIGENMSRSLRLFDWIRSI